MKTSAQVFSHSLKAMTIAALALAASSVFAAGESPVGRWQTIDDETGKPKSVVEIKEVNGELQGSVVELINPSKPNPTCDKCEGDRKDKPIQGMTILWGVKKTGDSWGDGKILDPQKGKIYGAKLEPEAGGQKLKVRGYMGVSLLGRTQEWVRAQ